MTTTPDWIFLLWGQSNMAGRAEVLPEDREPISGILAWDDLREEWVSAVDPIFRDKPTAGFGMARTFASIVKAQYPDRTIGVIPSAIGGSKLNEWAPGLARASLYERAMFQTKRATKNGGELKGLLWHQGEGDCADEELARSYTERLCKTLTEARNQLQKPNLPIVMGELGQFLNGRERYPFAEVVNEQLQQATTILPCTAFVTSEGCSHIGDELHFNRDGLILFGQRYAQAWLKLHQ